MKKAAKWFSIILCATLLVAIVYFVFAFFGNPISFWLAERSTNQYMKDHLADTDFQVTNVNYNFKTGGYYAHIDSPTSQDSYFTIHFDGLGQYRYDTYENIANGNNTFSRLYTQYRDLTDPILDTMPFEVSISFGDLRPTDYYEVFTYIDENGESREYTINKNYGINISELQLDKEYNIHKIGQSGGNICLYIHDANITVERAAELLLEIKMYLDEQGIPFHAMNFNLCEPLNEQGQNVGEQITLFDFLYADIYEEGLVDRVQQHWDIAREHFAIQDGIKNKTEHISP